MRRRLWIAGSLVIALLFIVVTSRVSASDFRQGDQCLIAGDEVIDGDIYVICNTLTIEGTVNGDVVGGAWAAVVAEGGYVHGDIWLLGGQLTIEGEISDDIRFGGVDLDLKAPAELGDGSDLVAVALSVEVFNRAVVPGDLVMLGYQTIIDGAILGDVHVDGSALVIGGMVQGEVDAAVGGGDTSPSFIPFPFPFSVSFQPPGLTVRSSGRIEGDVTYTAPRPGNISGRISGAINYTPDLAQVDITTPLDDEAGPLDLVRRYLRSVLIDVLSLLVAGFLVMVIAPAWIREPSRLAPRHVPTGFGWGLIIALVSAPISLIMLIASILLIVFVSFITLGGFTLMSLLLAVTVNTVVIGGMLFVILYLARLVVSDWIGRRIGRRFWEVESNKMWPRLATLFVGATAYALLAHIPIPYVGLIINAIGIFIGLGAVALHTRQLYDRTSRRRSYPAPLPTSTLPDIPTPPLAALRGYIPPPPRDDSEPAGPGMGDLPEGFRWWERDR